MSQKLKLDLPRVLHQRQTQGETLTVKELRKLERWKWSTAGLLSSARDHVGKILDNVNGSTVKDGIESVMLLALAAQSYKVFNGQKNGVETALIGPVGFKLATAPGSGTPPVSQIAGLGILSALGVTSLVGQTSFVAGNPTNPVNTSIKSAQDIAADINALLAQIKAQLGIR
jgi:hypothetical protein